MPFSVHSDWQFASLLIICCLLSMLERLYVRVVDAMINPSGGDICLNGHPIGCHLH